MRHPLKNARQNKNFWGVHRRGLNLKREKYPLNELYYFNIKIKNKGNLMDIWVYLEMCGRIRKRGDKN